MHTVYTVNMKNVVNIFCLVEFRLLLFAIFTGKCTFHIFQLHPHVKKLVRLKSTFLCLRIILLNICIFIIHPNIGPLFSIQNIDRYTLMNTFIPSQTPVIGCICTYIHDEVLHLHCADAHVVKRLIYSKIR